MTTKPAITPALFDATITPAGKPERLWGAPSIAAALGVSADTVRAWARLPDVPIYQPRPRRYFALRSELIAWVRTKQTA